MLDRNMADVMVKGTKEAAAAEPLFIKIKLMMLTI